MRWVLFLLAAIKLSAQCGITVTPAYFDGTHNSSTIPAGGGTYTLTISTDATCTWTAQSSVPWITVGSGSTGPGTLSWTVAPNTVNTGRGGIIALSGGWQIPVIQVGATCTLSLAPVSATAPVGGGAASLAVQTGCAWNAFSNNSTWLTVPASTSGTGNGAVNYTVAPNGCVAGRSGTLTVQAGSLTQSNTASPNMFFTVNQDGSVNNLTISPATASLDVSGGTGKVTVTTASGCGWSAYTDVNWLQIQNGVSGTGASAITYLVPVNTGAPRVGHILVGAQTFTVSQAGVAIPTPQLTAIVNAASYATGPVAPGEVVALGGTGLGPSPGAGAQLAPGGHALATTVAGVQVVFDGKYAAVPTYVSSTQINAIVPYEVAGQATTQIQVQYQGGTSERLQAQVQPAAPGIFTLDFNGIGPAAVLNQDYSLNGKSNPALRGSVVMIFCTGGGVTNPPSTDAAITVGAPPLGTQPVTVTIGGIASPNVTYAGGAPQAVAGLTQINAVVPPDAPTGPNVPLLIQVGSWQSQAGVTIAVQ